MCFRPWSVVVAICCTLVCLCPSRIWEPQVRCCTPYAALQVPNREEKKITSLDLLCFAQYFIAFICCGGALLTSAQFVHQNPWVLICGAAFQLIVLLPGPLCRLFLPMYRALHLLNPGKFLPACFSCLLSPPKW